MLIKARLSQFKYKNNVKQSIKKMFQHIVKFKKDPNMVVILEVDPYS